ncbi:hypothetical protein Acsp01_80250 [Actinoplanes sp. NBRC 101535]|nr:hypothetical protein Acsp01_80250 [Actinoplanes sp. NBRC 101535]
MRVRGEYAHGAAAGVRRVLLDANRTGSRAEGRFDGRQAGDDIGDALTWSQLDAGTPSPGVDDGRHDARAGQADLLGQVGPRVDDPVHSHTGSATSMCPPRHAERNRGQDQERR